MDNNSIKDNVCKFRKQRKMTQEEMADLLGISITAYRELEKGSTSMMNQHILKMARITNTPTEEIVLGYMPAQIDNPGKLGDLQAEYEEKIKERDRRIAELEADKKQLQGLLSVLTSNAQSVGPKPKKQ